MAQYQGRVLELLEQYAKNRVDLSRPNRRAFLCASAPPGHIPGQTSPFVG